MDSGISYKSQKGSLSWNILSFAKIGDFKMDSSDCPRIEIFFD
jgi:hypothetical protein